MKTILLSALLLSAQAFASNDGLLEIESAFAGGSIVINNQTFVTSNDNTSSLLKGTQIQSPTTGEVYTVTGEIIIEHLLVIDAKQFAADNKLELSYIRGSRAIYRHADANVDLIALNAQLASKPGVVSTQLGLHLEGLEAE